MEIEKPRPFFDGRDAVPLEMFAGRKSLCDKFAALTWNRQEKRTDFIWVIEGRSSFGKSSFANWCRQTANLEASHGEVVMCVVSLTDKFQMSVQVGREEFYRFLYERILEAFLTRVKTGKAWRFKQKITRKFYQLYDKLHQGEYFNFKLPPLEHAPQNPIDFLQRLQMLHRAANIEIKAFVLIIDDASLCANGPRLCGDFVMAAKKYSNNWPGGFPNFVLVLLPFPDWDHEMIELGLRRRIDDCHRLQPFDKMEILDFVQRRCRETGWHFDIDTFVPALHAMSGGIPFLLQQIGAGACRSSERRAPGRFHLNAEDVFHAVIGEDAHVTRTVRDTIHSVFRFDPKLVIANEYESKLLPHFYRAKPLEAWNGPAVSEAIPLMTKAEWKNRVLNPFDKTPPYQQAFEKIWEALSRHGLLVHADQQPGKYSFCAEAIRHYFDRYNPR